MEKVEVLMAKHEEVERSREDVAEAMEALVRVKGLEDSNAKLKTERSELYDAQVLLKEEISQLRQDKSKLTRFLDDTRRELGALKQANIVSQMMESHLLRSATDVETDSVKVEVGSVHGSTAAMSELEEAEAKQEQPGWDNDSQFEGAEDRSANELAGGEGEAAAAAAAAFGGFGDEDNDGWGDGWEEEGADT